MKFKSLTALIGAAVCVLAVSGARAEVPYFVTNEVAFKAVSTSPVSTNDNSTTTTYIAHTAAANNATLLAELGPVVISNSFSASAKLVLVTGNNDMPFFAVIDGANFYNLSSNGVGGLNIMNMGFPNDVQVQSGSQSDSTSQKSITDTRQIIIGFDDTGITNGIYHGNLQFALSGIVTYTEMRSAISTARTVTDVVKGKASSLTGVGSYAANPFVVTTATISFSGKGTFTVPVP